MKNIYAGKPVKVLSKEVCPNYQYMRGDVSLDLSRYKVGKICGTSLEKEGIEDGSFVFYKEITWFRRKLHKHELMKQIEDGAFLIFKNDANRVKQEYPDRKIVNGWKIRKVISYIDTNITDETLQLLVKVHCKDDEYNEDLLNKIRRKFKFAQKYYKDDKLIMSITYHGGTEKDFSFHSVSFLRGKVKYVTADTLKAA